MELGKLAGPSLLNIIPSISISVKLFFSLYGNIPINSLREISTLMCLCVYVCARTHVHSMAPFYATFYLKKADNICKYFISIEFHKILSILGPLINVLDHNITF